ncbi:MAG: heparinase II/III family protein [Opitutaceae bacterium]|jgi:hypothetical protein
MKLPLFAFLALFAVSFAFARDKAPPGFYEGYTGFAIPAEPVLPAKEIHPALWFHAVDLPALKARLSADEFARSRWAAVQKLADLSASVPPEPAATDKTEVIHKYYGAMSVAARAHALVALLIDDPIDRAAHQKRAQELLLRAFDGPIYELDPRKQGTAVDEIYQGVWLQTYAAAYDCLQPVLTPEIDRKIRARLIREAAYVYDNLYTWTKTSPHNHLSKPAWGLGSMALALSSDPQAKLWLGRALEASNKNTRFFFSDDGLYREGSHYLLFSLTNFVPFLYHYRNVSGVDDFPAFQPVFEAMVKVRNSHGWLPNIEDSYIRPTPTHLVADAYRKASTNLHSSAPLSEILTWSYQTCDLAPFGKKSDADGFNYTGASWDYPLEIDELLTHDATIRATAPDAAPTVFLKGGQTVFRNAWTAPDAGQRYLLFHGVAVADNHNHDDQLSFILEAEGQMMCSAAGYSRGTYTGSERTDWYITAPANNTLTLDGHPADEKPTNLTPPTVFRVEQPGLVGEAKKTFFGDAAEWTRAILWIAGDYYAIVDQLSSSKPLGEVKSYLHGGRATLSTDGTERTWTYSADRYGPAAKLRTWIAAPGATITEKKGELTYIKGDYGEFPYLETSSTKYSSPWITLLKPAAINETAPFSVQDRSGDAFTALLVTAADHRTLIAARAPASPPFAMGGVETDATLIIVRRDLSGKVIDHFVNGASYLRIDGHSVD